MYVMTKSVDHSMTILVDHLVLIKIASNELLNIGYEWIDAYNLLYVVYAKSFKIKFSCPSKFSLNAWK